MAPNSKLAPELLLAQLILSSVVVGLLGHATYEKDFKIPGPFSGKDKWLTISLNRYIATHEVMSLFSVIFAYFFANLIYYGVIKLGKDHTLEKTVLILMQNVVFCVLIFICSIATIANIGDNVTGGRRTEIGIAAGISLFCCVSSGVGVFYSYRVYKDP